MKKIIILFTIFCCSINIQAQIITGFVKDADTGNPISHAFVVIMETEVNVETNDDGAFSITHNEEGVFTLRAAAEAYENLDTKYNAVPTKPITLLLKARVIEMDTVETWADRPEITSSRTVDSEDIRKTATGENPFALVDKAPETVSITMPALDNDIATTKNDIESAVSAPILSLMQTFDFRGLPYYSNMFFLDRKIPLMFQYYNLYGIMIGSIFPQGLLDSIEMYGAGKEPSLGPGAGLISSVNIGTNNIEKMQTEVSTSILALSAIFKTPLFENNGGLIISVRKSLYEFTWIPLLIELNKTYKFMNGFGVGNEIVFKNDLFPGNIDAFAKFWFKPNDKNKLEAIIFTATAYSNISQESYTSWNYINSGYLTLSSQSCASLVWDSNILPGLDFSLSAYDILLWNSKSSWNAKIGGEKDLSQFDYPLNEAGGRTEFSWQIVKNTILSGGMSGRFITGWYEQKLIISPLSFFKIQPKLRGASLNTEEVSSWLELSTLIGTFELIPSIRIDYLPIAKSPNWNEDIFISPMLHAYWYPIQEQAFHIGGGMRYDRFDYPSRHIFSANQGISVINQTNETTNTTANQVIDEMYLQKSPARLFTLESDWAYNTQNLKTRLGAYGAYMDEMSGFNLDTYYSSQSLVYLQNDDTYLGLKDAKALWSCGFNGDLALGSKTLSLDILYNFQVCRYLVDMEENNNYTWIIPKNDISNMLKFYGHFEPDSSWLFDATLKVLIGIPATPNKVVEVKYYPGGDSVYCTPVTSKAYQLRDYMPRFNIDFKTAYRFGTDVRWELFLNVANLISFPHYTQPSGRTLGFEEQSMFDREYNWWPIWLYGLMEARVDLGLKVTF